MITYGFTTPIEIQPNTPFYSRRLFANVKGVCLVVIQYQIDELNSGHRGHRGHHG
jgi:hypothetical protein